ncbi:uncharacterized protein LOC135957649 [Calliphora vicina]|uniref:uncharacterized protein LOC135957649 n=1 Tax=Calliphora vicina TaxID=7373 RepID=UPI00325B0CD5
MAGQGTDSPIQVSDVQNIVSASVGLHQIQFMKEVDNKIQKALDDMKQLILSLPMANPAPMPTMLSPIDHGVPQTEPPRTFLEAQPSVYGQLATPPGQPTFQQPPPLIPAPNYVPIGPAAPRVVEASIQPPPVQTQYEQQQSLLQQQNPLPLIQQPAAWYSQVQQLLPQANPQTYSQQPAQRLNQSQTVLQSQNQLPYVQPQQFNQQQQLWPQPQPGPQANLRCQSDSQTRYPQDTWSRPAALQRPQQPPLNYNLAMSMPRPQESLDKFKLAKWGVKFDGTNKTMNVQEFIFRVGALRRDYSCSDDEILRTFHLLLEGPALDWYWDYRKMVHINTWEELEKALLAQYRRFEQEHEVQMKILNRRQLPQEAFDDFYNAVIKLRNQQQHPYAEEQLVEIMRGNLKPSLAQMMFSMRLKTLSEFGREVRRAENLIANQRQLYQRANVTHRVNELVCEDEDLSLIDLEIDGIRSTSHYTCWNCKVVGHSFVDCPEPINRQFCFRCGKDNVVAPKCPKCQGNRFRNPSQTGETRSTEV